MDKYLQKHVYDELYSRVEVYSLLSDHMQNELVINAINAVNSYRPPVTFDKGMLEQNCTQEVLGARNHCSPQNSSSKIRKSSGENND